MSVTFLARLGAVATAGLIGFAASAALAGTDNEVIVSQHAPDARAMQVAVADLDLGTQYDRRTLAIRIDKAARQVCDVNEGSRLDGMPSALSCVDQARTGALAQLEQRGLDGRQLAQVSFGGMR